MALPVGWSELDFTHTYTHTPKAKNTDRPVLYGLAIHVFFFREMVFFFFKSFADFGVDSFGILLLCSKNNFYILDISTYTVPSSVLGLIPGA